MNSIFKRRRQKTKCKNDLIGLRNEFIQELQILKTKLVSVLSLSKLLKEEKYTEISMSDDFLSLLKECENYTLFSNSNNLFRDTSYLSVGSFKFNARTALDKMNDSRSAFHDISFSDISSIQIDRINEYIHQYIIYIQRLINQAVLTIFQMDQAIGDESYISYLSTLDIDCIPAFPSLDETNSDDDDFIIPEVLDNISDLF